MVGLEQGHPLASAAVNTSSVRGPAGRPDRQTTAQPQPQDCCHPQTAARQPSGGRHSSQYPPRQPRPIHQFTRSIPPGPKPRRPEIKGHHQGSGGEASGSACPSTGRFSAITGSQTSDAPRLHCRPLTATAARPQGVWEHRWPTAKTAVLPSLYPITIGNRSIRCSDRCHRGSRQRPPIQAV